MIFDLMEARGNVGRQQERLGCFPRCVVSVNGFVFHLAEDDACIVEDIENRLDCTLDHLLLQRILNREEHWNNAELGCHIMFDRKGPYMPDVHTLMSFFHRPSL